MTATKGVSARRREPGPAEVAEPAVGAPAAVPERSPPRRRSLGLGTRVFLITGLLIALAVGAAVVFTAVYADRAAHRAAVDELAASAELQRAVSDDRYRQLQLLAQVFVSDPYLAAYVLEASSRGNPASILDLLGERRGDLGYDFAIVLDPTGRVLARTDRPAGAGQDLSDRPLVAAALTDYTAAGVWSEGGELYQAVAVPIARGPQLVGFLVTGFGLSDDTAGALQRMSGTEVAFLAREDGGLVPVASSLPADRGQALAEQLGRGGELERMLAGAGSAGEAAGDGGSAAAPDVELELGGEGWIARSTALLDAAGEAVGASVALSPLAPQVAPYRRIEQVLAAAGLTAVLLAFGLSFAFARRTTRPVRELVAATAAARAGDYERPIPTARGDEIGDLARSFEGLLSELRQKRDTEEYLADIARQMPEAGTLVSARADEVSRVPATLALFELRAHARGGAEGGESAALERFTQDVRRLSHAVAPRHGELVAAAGHRLWVRFTGERRSFRALLAAAEMLQADARAGTDAGVAPVVALAAGDTVSGPVEWGDERRTALLGRPVQELDSLVREVAPGDVALSAAVYDELRSTLERAGYELAEQRGVLASQPLYVVGPELARRLVAAETGELPAAGVGAGSAPAAGGLAELGPGSVVGGRFELLSVLGAGGMGVVFKARDRELDELVALKMLKPEVSRHGEAVARMRDELRLARRITHPNVLRTFDLGEVDGLPFISMEYVHGVTLAQLLERTGRLPYSAGLRVAQQLCRGLAAAHDEGVLHRDIKPANLLLQPNGNLKLMDFGVARRVRRLAPGQTGEGWLVGTPRYLAPEQLRGEEPDERADIYACGVVLYEVFTGGAPFDAGSYTELAAKTLSREPPPPSERWPEMPPDLERIILRCLRKEPAERYHRAADLLEDLSALRA